MTDTPDKKVRPCSVCGRTFIPSHPYQVTLYQGQERCYCSQPCLLKDVVHNPRRQCSVCGAEFDVGYGNQVVLSNGQLRLYCGPKCRQNDSPGAAPVVHKTTRRLAVLNQKGGTGKTSTAVNLSAAFATRGSTVLLVDMDPQGNVGVSLGVRGDMAAYKLLMTDEPLDRLTVPIRADLDIITADESLAAADMELVSQENREHKLSHRLKGQDSEYDLVVLDCAPTLSLLNRNALLYADEVVIPVSCDYLALIGVKQVLKTIADVERDFNHALTIAGVVPTFFDQRNRISHEVMRNLSNRFGDKVTPPVRINTRIKEAPIYKKTIFEYDASSYGAQDYLALADFLSPGRK